MKKRGQNKPKQELSDGGPLAWLAGFTSFGLDSRTPRPPFPKILECRSLGLDARRKGYAIDMERPYEIQPFPADPDHYGHAEILVQRYRGVAKRCIRIEGREELVPLPGRPEEEPGLDYAALSSFLAEWPARSIIQDHQPSADNANIPWHARGPNGPGVVKGMLHVQQFVRSSFLDMIWTREQYPEADPDVDWRLKWTIFCILRYCVAGENDVSRLIPAFGPFNPVLDRDAMLIGAAAVEQIVWKLRADVLPIPHPRSLDLLWLGGGFPAIIWAEVLNAFQYDRASWPLLRCCGWCGRHWVAIPNKRGRPAEFCDDHCRRRFNDYGSSDPRF